MAWARDRTGGEDIVVVVSSPDSRWRAFSDISVIPEADGDLAVVSFADGGYGDAGMTTVKLRVLIEQFMRENGDLEVALVQDGEVFRGLHVNVDQDTDDYGDAVGWVAILQAYAVKTSLKR